MGKEFDSSKVKIYSCQKSNPQSTMSNKLKPKKSISEVMLSTSAYGKPLLDNNLFKSLHAPCEIFRNKTTAVEVIVKEVNQKGKTQIITNADKEHYAESTTIKRLHEDIKKLRSELYEVHSNLEKAQRSFKVILCEMKKQLEGANQRELQTQTKNLALQLEKEKLRTLLDSKSNLIAKLKKEFTSVKRMLKVVMKGIQYIPSYPENVYHSDVKYEDFETDLGNSAFIAVTENSLDNESRLEPIMASK